MARQSRKRYVVRLHPAAARQITETAEKRGWLPATFLSNILEEITPRPEKYEIYDENMTFQLNRGPGSTKAKQTSVYLSDATYEKIALISRNLVENVDRDMTPTFVIRDLVTKWMDENI